MKKELMLEGLCCANCASKIESKAKEIDGIKELSLNFLTKTLSFEVEEAATAKRCMDEICTIVKKIEPDVIVSEKQIAKNEKVVLILDGLDCANCAAKIEARVNGIKGVKEAHLDFVSKKLTYEIASKAENERICGEITEIVNKLEPDVKVLAEDKKAEAAEEEDYKKEVAKISIAAVLFGTALFFKLPQYVEIIFYVISYLLVGTEVIIKAVKNILNGQVFDENFLMAVATIGAVAIKQYPEGVAVMLFYQIGEFFQDLAVNKSRKSIAALMDIRPDYANLVSGEEIKVVSPEDVMVGDIIIVKPGEKVPLDGEVIEGASSMDTSALTGEALPREVSTGSEVLSGFVNKNGLIKIKVAKEFGEATVTKILDLVQNASAKKAKTENFITKFARVYTPAVVIIAALLAIVPPIVTDASFSDCFYRALVFLVVSCPCALVISIPLSFFGGIGSASKHGILVKGSSYLEALKEVDTLVFDKTGTLTKGNFAVTEINPEGISADKLIEYAAYAESYSNHPIAQSIMKAYGKDIDNTRLEKYDELAGYGVKAIYDGKTITVGNFKLLKEEKIAAVENTSIGTVVYVAVDGKYAGCIVISDEIKPDAEMAIKSLSELGIKRKIMLTGDNKAVADKISKNLGMDEYYAELLPHQKVEILENIFAKNSGKGKVAFVGDGINDAPVLARADVGIAMGGLGSDAAIEAADIVIMTDEPSKIASAVRIARKTRNVVWQNIIFALGVKAIVLILGGTGHATIWEAVFADVGVALIAVVNAMRVMKIKE